MNYFGKGSRSKLVGVHVDLVLVAGYALVNCPIDWSVVEGMRHIARQRLLKARGKSRTLDSRHLPGASGVCYAIDVEPWIPGSSVWKLSKAVQWEMFHMIAASFKLASRELHIPVLWGGDWRTFKDGPHFYLSRRLYPKGIL